MENASKALIIAGSVLIAILLIAVGVKVFNSTDGTTDAVRTTMDTTAVATFNNQFTDYMGTDISKSKVKALLNKMIANNATNTAHKVTVNGGSTDVPTFLSSLTSNKYNITINAGCYDDEGYIKNINITT